MRHKVVTAPIARACQTASLLLILAMVFGVLVDDLMREGARSEVARAETCPLGSFPCTGSPSASRQP